MSAIETRSRTLAPGELRFAVDGGTRRMTGRAVVYGELSEDLGGFWERFEVGSIELAPDPVLLFDHDTSMVLGRSSAGTARFTLDGRGLSFEADPPDTQWARDLGISMGRGDIRQCSFCFECLDDYFYFDTQLGGVIRSVRRARVSEASIVTMPAYPQTSVSMT